MAAQIVIRNNIVEVDDEAYSAQLIVLKGVLTGELTLAHGGIEATLTVKGDARVSKETEGLFIEGSTNINGPFRSVLIKEAQKGFEVTTESEKMRGVDIVVKLDNARCILNITLHPLSVEIIVENPHIEVDRSIFSVVVKARSL